MARTSQLSAQIGRVRGCDVSKEDGFYLALSGALVWGAATLFYAAFAGGLIEQAFWFYALNAALATAALTFFFHVTARLRHLSQRRRPLAAITFTAPGVFGAALVILNFQALMPHLPPESLGRYGAFVVVAYSALLALCLERPAKTA